MYSSALGRFVSADTIVPEPKNPQSLNRYTYANNSPVKFNDPSGHVSTCAVMGAGPYGMLLCFAQWAVEGAIEIGAALGVGYLISELVSNPEAIGSLVQSGVAVAATPLVWAMQDMGPDYPMPTEYIPGAVQATYPLPGTNTLMTGAGTVVFSKPARGAIQSLAEYLGLLLGSPTGGFDPFDPKDHRPKPNASKEKLDIDHLRHIRNDLAGLADSLGKLGIGLAEYMSRYLDVAQQAGLTQALERLLSVKDYYTTIASGYMTDILKYLESLGYPVP
jgi:hypothetical protein